MDVVVLQNNNNDDGNGSRRIFFTLVFDCVWVSGEWHQSWCVCDVPRGVVAVAQNTLETMAWYVLLNVEYQHKHSAEATRKKKSQSMVDLLRIDCCHTREGLL